VKEDRGGVPRKEVIYFYATYDRAKKGQSPLADLATWPWEDPDGIDCKLEEHGLKKGVLAAYQTWVLCQLSVADILECAVVNRIIPGEPQALSQLVLRGKLKEWLPIGSPAWWRLLGSGADLDVESSLILRPALKSEAPKTRSCTSAAPRSHRWVYDVPVSPTIFRQKGFRFFFFSREESRFHVHVYHVEGEAKFWLEPEIELAQNYGLNTRRLSTALDLIRRHQNEIGIAWKKHFGS